MKKSKKVIVPFSKWIIVANGKRTAYAVLDDFDHRGNPIWWEASLDGCSKGLPFVPTHYLPPKGGSWMKIEYDHEVSLKWRP